MSTSADSPASSGRASLLIALLVSGSFFMENLDGSVLATALPQMARSFHTSPVNLNVGLTAYLLTLAVFIPMSGWVADRFGAREVFGAAVAVFTISSFACGLSHSVPEFTLSRIAQGIGGAMMVPVGRLVVLRTTQPKDLINAIAYITWPGLVAPILGPPVGGFLTTYASWRWIFFLNIPLGMVALIMTYVLIRNQPAQPRRPFDSIGFVLAGGACTSVLYGMDLIGRAPVDWAQTIAVLTAGAVLSVLAVLHLRRTTHPVIDLTPLRTQTFAVTIWGASLFRIAVSSVPFLLPLMFQVGFGMSAFHSGLLVLAVFAGNLAIKPATTLILRRFGFRTVMIANGLLFAGTVFACGLLFANTPVPVIFAVLFFGGVCRSMQYTAIATIAFADIPPVTVSGANTLFSMVQTITTALGIALGAVALRFAAHLHPIATEKLTVTDFHLAFAVMGLVALASLYDSFALPGSAGANVSGHKTQAANG